MSQLIKDEGDYVYKTDPVYKDSQSIGYMPAVIATGEAFLALEKRLLEVTGGEGLTKYHEGIQVEHIVLAIDGVPWGTVMYLDDALQFVPFDAFTAR